jgi:micrococcal nuclease
VAALRRKYEGKQAQITEVVNGDTVKVRITRTTERITVRLLGIDTPETRRPGVRAECGGPEATEQMKANAFTRPANPYALPPFPGKIVTLDTDESQDVKDSFGRLLAYVDTAEGMDLGRAMVASGWATVHVFKRNFQRLRAYESSESQAQAKSLGVYGQCGGNFHSEQ